MRRTIALAGFLGIAFATGSIAQTAAVQTSVRPDPRPEKDLVVQVSVNPARFDVWLDGFRKGAARRGISRSTLDRALSGVQFREDVIAKDRNQSEFTKQLWEYLDSAVSDSRIRNGKAALRENGAILDAIEKRFGVEKEVVLAIWGLESAYGTHRGDVPVIDALATLAFDGRRGKFFSEQLLAALKIVQSGDVTPRNMTGSWAGAMGHTQFIPTSYLGYAVDFRGDGKRDIWSDDPTDALASTAAYLKKFGWTYGQPWGLEVKLPRGFDYSEAGEHVKKDSAAWTALGVRTVDGRPLPDHGLSSIRLPAGASGPAFATFNNFRVIERYNSADSYVIAVGHLTDRVAGGKSFRADWPRNDRGLRFSEKKELQQRLTAKGYSTKGVDGIVGPNTIAAVRRFQQSQGLVPDGYVSYELLRRLR